MLTWNDIESFIKHGNPKATQRIEKTDEEWKAILDAETFRITRLAGTERAFSSDMCNRFEAGTYACACCNSILFEGEEKYNSHSGWPSFTQAATPNAISYHADHKLRMRRIEVCCNSCDAHLGHVFPDGPKPSGLRYCINAAALRKISN